MFIFVVMLSTYFALLIKKKQFGDGQWDMQRISWVFRQKKAVKKYACVSLCVLLAVVKLGNTPSTLSHRDVRWMGEL